MTAIYDSISILPPNTKNDIVASWVHIKLVAVISAHLCLGFGHGELVDEAVTVSGPLSPECPTFDLQPQQFGGVCKRDDYPSTWFAGKSSSCLHLQVRQPLMP